jgi:hypothetical protein
VNARERKRLAMLIWRRKHRDYRSTRGSPHHPAVLVLNPRTGGTESWPLLKISERDFKWLAKHSGVLEAAAELGEFLEEQVVAVTEVERGDTLRVHGEWSKLKRKKRSPTGGVELYFENGEYMHVPRSARIPITYED